MRGDRKQTLSERQMQTLRYIAAGMTDAEMGAVLFVAECTAKRHVRDILMKLGARNRANAVHIAHERGLL